MTTPLQQNPIPGQPLQQQSAASGGSGPGIGVGLAAMLVKLLGIAYAVSPALRNETIEFGKAGARGVNKALGNPFGGP